MSPRPSAAGGDGLIRVLCSALCLAAAAAPVSWNLAFGVNLWALWSLPVRILVAAGALAAIWAPAPPSRRDQAVPAWVLGGAVLLLWLLAPARSTLFGDSLAISHGPGEYPITPRSPVFTALADVAAHLAGSNPGYRWILGLFEVGFGVGLAALVGAIERRRPGGFTADRAVVYVGGYLAVFAAYLEAYAVFALLLAAYLAALNLRPGWKQALVVAILQAAVFAGHVVGVALAPVTLWVVLRPLRWTPRRALAVVGALAGAVAVLAAAVRLVPGMPPALDPVAAVPFAVDQFLTAFEHRPWSWRFGVFHPRHAANVLNTGLLAAAPALAALVALAGSGTGRRALSRAGRTPLGAAAGLLLLSRLLVTTPLGPVLDWDLLAVLLLPLVFLIASAWGDEEMAPLRRGATPALAALGFVTLLPWVLTLHDPARSRTRLEAHVGGAPGVQPWVAAALYQRLAEDPSGGLSGTAQASAFRLAYDAYPRSLFARQEGNAWLAGGDAARARDAFDRALALDPDDRMSRAMRATVLSRLGFPRDAEHDYDTLLVSDPGDPWGWYGRAALALNRGEADSANVFLDRAVTGYRARLEENPDNAGAQRQLVLCLVMLSRWSEVEHEIETIMKHTDPAASDWYHLGLARYQLGRTSEAVSALARATALDPSDRHVAATYAGAVLASGDAATAVTLCTDLLARGDDAGVRVTRAEALNRLGRKEEAVADLNRALELEPQNPIALRLRERLGP